MRSAIQLNGRYDRLLIEAWVGAETLTTLGAIGQSCGHFHLNHLGEPGAAVDPAGMPICGRWQVHGPCGGPLPSLMLLFGAALRWRVNQSGQTSYQMGKGRDRGPRRRGFEDDSYTPPPSPYERPQQAFRRAPRENSAPSGPAVDAVVKWFNPDKGFGFVELGDGSGDAFLHIAVLQAAGHDAVDPETKMSVQVGQGQKGRQVTAVLTVDAASGGGGGGAPRSAARPPQEGHLAAASALIRQPLSRSKVRSSGSTPTKGLASSSARMAARMCSYTSPSSNAPACAGWTRDSDWR